MFHIPSERRRFLSPSKSTFLTFFFSLISQHQPGSIPFPEFLDEPSAGQQVRSELSVNDFLLLVIVLSQQKPSAAACGCDAVCSCLCQCKHHHLCVWQRENSGVNERFGPAVRLAVICLSQSPDERRAPELLPRLLPPLWYDVAARLRQKPELHGRRLTSAQVRREW